MVGEEGECNACPLLFINNLKLKIMILQDLITTIICVFLIVAVFTDYYASRIYMEGSYAYYIVFITVILILCLLTYLLLMFITIK